MSVLNDDIEGNNDKDGNLDIGDIEFDDDLRKLVAKKYQVKQYDSDIGVIKVEEDKNNKIDAKSNKKLKRSNAVVIKPKNKLKSPNSHKRTLN
jgi:hypothetical protein